MDTVSPQALEHLCLDFVCENIENLCQEVPQGDGYAFPRLVFKRSTYLHEHLAEGLLNRLTSSGKLSSKSLTLFLDGKTCRLKRVCIQNADVQDIVLKSLLTRHAISELDLSGVKVNLNPELGFSLALSLQRLKLSNINGALSISLICQLKYLRHLDISRKNIGTEDMVHISCALPLLESLNISCTEVKDLKSLRNLQKSLKVLCAYNIPESLENLEVLAEFTLLQQLDLSRNPLPGNLERPNSDVKRLEEFLEKPGILPNLTHLDVSGMAQVKETAVQAFLDFHPKLQFLGLFKTNMSHVQFLPKQLKVTGETTEKQVLASLEHYPDRAIYMKEALGCLYDFSKNWTERRPEVLELVFQAMDMHFEKLEIQVVATACIYNLTRSNNADQEDIHVTLLSKIAQVILPAMKEFPKSNELIRNSLLILDRPKLLMKAKLDRYLLASLAMDVVREFSSNPNIAKYAIKLCVVVSAEISASETRLLGSEMNIATLVSVIEYQVDENRFGDSTLISLAFHLIWNFTDGAPDTCDLFVCRGGLEVAKKIINQINFIDNDGQKMMISRNIVGTLNNIAEVPELRHHLITDEFMRILCNLLETPFGSLAFFSGGILSNLLLNWDDCIRLQYHTKGQILQKIENAVARRVMPDEVIAYRSFASFMPLILSNIPAVQLWALSGVIHVTSANSSRYIPMVENSGVLAFVESLLSSDTPQHQGVHRLAVKLSEMVKCKRAKGTAQI